MIQTFAVHTLGCKVNQYEGRQLRELLERLGLTGCDTSAQPDLVVVNTCCVTHTASAKSRQYIRKAQKLSPNAAIIVAGCLPTAKTGELTHLDANVHLVGHNDDLLAVLCKIMGKSSYLPLIQEVPANQSAIAARGRAQPAGRVGEAAAETSIKPEKTHKVKNKNNLVCQTNLGPISSFTGHTRAFLKVQDGCDAYCSYCIVPKIRRKVCSKPQHIVLAEAQRLVAAGHKEIVLTGVSLGAYRQDTVLREKWDKKRLDSLAALLKRVALVPGLARVRLSSLQPTDVTDALLDVFCNYHNIAPHLHLPLQSGSEKILRKMRRQYTAADFRNTIQKLKLRLDRPAVTTDIIVGFPGETDADFQQTVALAEEVGFAKIHVFAFSRRKGTAAATMQPFVPSKIIKERSRELQNLDKQLQDKFRRQFAGEQLDVIVEDTRPARGRTGRYFMVELKSPESVEKGRLIYAGLRKNGLTADVVKG